jgi:hypothetical protein
VARPSYRVWPLANYCHPLLPLGQIRGVVPRASGTAMASGYCWRVELEPAPCRWNCDSSASTCGRGTKKGATTTGETKATAEQTDEALGRSKGGFSTKIHLRAEGGGKPIALLITAGQRHEQTVFETLMEVGAVQAGGTGETTHPT